mmetsp:Transcript_25384/g.74721  ORF Transcript_25384/g.74721 Transcript_25384/m.74721 type:complete len:219 (+) Transcript_25384:1644-2300(+)
MLYTFTFPSISHSFMRSNVLVNISQHPAAANILAIRPNTLKGFLIVSWSKNQVQIEVAIDISFIWSAMTSRILFIVAADVIASGYLRKALSKLSLTEDLCLTISRAKSNAQNFPAVFLGSSKLLSFRKPLSSFTLVRLLVFSDNLTAALPVAGVSHFFLLFGIVAFPDCHLVLFLSNQGDEKRSREQWQQRAERQKKISIVRKAGWSTGAVYKYVSLP